MNNTTSLLYVRFRRLNNKKKRKFKKYIPLQRSNNNVGVVNFLFFSLPLFSLLNHSTGVHVYCPAKNVFRKNVLNKN